ncbi:hypothetical protein HED60_04890 [Planctomycetales bacterium ZRK34]|nr:hypothetical protein HED60_04890 [Planctomycetales bacterium ZRK34]
MLSISVNPFNAVNVFFFGLVLFLCGCCPSGSSREWGGAAIYQINQDMDEVISQNEADIQRLKVFIEDLGGKVEVEKTESPVKTESETNVRDVGIEVFAEIDDEVSAKLSIGMTTLDGSNVIVNVTYHVAATDHIVADSIEKRINSMFMTGK